MRKPSVDFGLSATLKWRDTNFNRTRFSASLPAVHFN